jgi:hemolysin III
VTTEGDLTGPLRDKPKLRGVLHQAAFVIALALAPLMIIAADEGRERLAASVFGGSVAACFGASALYHRVTWTPRVRLWMRRIDHAGVYLLIAGTYRARARALAPGKRRPRLGGAGVTGALLARYRMETGLVTSGAVSETPVSRPPS